jgi:hypothetical protein
MSLSSIIIDRIRIRYAAVLFEVANLADWLKVACSVPSASRMPRRESDRLRPPIPANTASLGGPSVRCRRMDVEKVPLLRTNGYAVSRDLNPKLVPVASCTPLGRETRKHRQDRCASSPTSQSPPSVINLELSPLIWFPYSRIRGFCGLGFQVNRARLSVSRRLG